MAPDHTKLVIEIDVGCWVNDRKFWFKIMLDTVKNIMVKIHILKKWYVGAHRKGKEAPKLTSIPLIYCNISWLHSRSHYYGDFHLSSVFNVFSIVRFKNEPCNGTLNILGTCYTSAECTQLGGTANGECASGFGVCCSCEKRQIALCMVGQCSSHRNIYQSR